VAKFTSRLAVPADVPALTVLMDAAIAELQRAFLDATQIESSRAIMGIDNQLIDDGTYFVVEADDDIAGCGDGAVARRSTVATRRRAVTATCSTQRSTRRPRAGHVHQPGLCPARRGPPDPVALRGCRRSRGIHATRADVHAFGGAPLQSVRVPTTREARRRHRWGPPCRSSGWRSRSIRACSADTSPQRQRRNCSVLAFTPPGPRRRAHETLLKLHG
jgi:hypothetical protein